MSRFVDLSHPIVAGMTTYPGIPGPTMRTFVSREESAQRRAAGLSFDLQRVDMVANTGTYLDAPFHLHAEGADVAQLPLERIVDVPIIVVPAQGRTRIEASLLGDPGLLWGAAVLVHTGWSRRWGSDAYFTGSPYLTPGTAQALVEANVALVGIDALNIDDIEDRSRPAHHILLAAGIPLLEHLTNLDAIPGTGARLTALPAPVRGMGTFPVRAVAVR
ncbi:MAG: putative metal-dependent hydrolase [Pseudonocardia sp.]|jgi:kynurenine formamidase|nr:putative metal-dependent hydrolase [Pseudonocardia sp.]